MDARCAFWRQRGCIKIYLFFVKKMLVNFLICSGIKSKFYKMQSSENIEKPLISVRGLKHRYAEGDGVKEVLHGIDVDFYQGEIVIIMGPSGSGKSTLLKLIGAQLTLQEGEIIIGDENLKVAEQAQKYPAHLSGGQRQRVAIARALIRKPRIVLADEPTASLDQKSGREIVEIIRKMAKELGVTVVLVTHDNRILDIADRIISLVDGNLEVSA